jgi:hypothetical protein
MTLRHRWRPEEKVERNVPLQLQAYSYRKGRRTGIGPKPSDGTQRFLPAKLALAGPRAAALQAGGAGRPPVVDALRISALGP